jgi:hypothetical protein
MYRPSPLCAIFFCYLSGSRVLPEKFQSLAQTFLEVNFRLPSKRALGLAAAVT